MRGSCLCGEIVFEVEGTIPALYQCHCSLCRKQTGASSNTAMAVASEQVIWVSGSQLISSYKRASGFRSDFCAQCGSPVPNQIGASPYTWVPAGLLDSTANLQIAAHLFVGSKAHWEPLPTNGKCYQETSALAEIIEYLYAHENT